MKKQKKNKTGDDLKKMVRHYCTYCKEIKDSSFFSLESNHYQSCINCFNANFRNTKIQEFEYELNRLKELETLETIGIKPNTKIQEFENELNRLKELETLETIDSIKPNGIILEYLDNINKNILEIKSQLSTFRIETNELLKTILSKYGLDNKESKANLLNYESKTVNLNEALELYHSLDELEFIDVMKEAYNLTHKNPVTSWNKKVKTWSNKYPDIVGRKINGIKNKLKEANKDLKKSKQMKDLYYSEKMIEFRLPTIRKMLNNRGHLNVSNYSIMDSLKTNYKWTNTDIMNDLIANKNDNPDNDIDYESMYEEQEPSEFDLVGSSTNPSLINQKDIMNSLR